MGSSSRQALSAATSALTDAREESAGAELLAASAEIGRTPALQAALADGSVDASAKSALVERIFSGATAGARSVLSAAAREAWSNSDEFVAGIEELGLRAEATTHEGLADELLAAASTIDSSHELELSLGDKLGESDAKVALVERLFSGKLSASAVGVVSHMVANSRGRRLSSALRESARVAADQGGTELATVTVAAPLTAEQEAKLAALLEKSAGRPVRVTVEVDPDLIGGVRVQLGGDVIDGSVRTRLEDLRLRLAS